MTGIPGAAYEDAAKAFWTRFNSEIMLTAGAFDVLDFIRASGIRSGVVSSGNREPPQRGKLKMEMPKAVINELGEITKLLKAF